MLLVESDMYPRIPTAHSSLCERDTWTPGTSRSNSGMVVALERCMSSEVITKTAAGVFHTSSGCLEAMVTFTLPSCSSDIDFSWYSWIG